MTEEEALDWCVTRYPGAVDTLRRYSDILRAAASTQNLVAASTTRAMWSRHLVDSAQLLDHVQRGWNCWADIGSGAGLPGLVISILTGEPVRLIEPRRLRVAFLFDCINILGLRDIDVFHSKAETATLKVEPDVISARAVASIDRILGSARAFTGRQSVFVLPKGATAAVDVANAKRSWHGTFHVEQSIVDPSSGIVIASQVRPR